MKIYCRYFFTFLIFLFPVAVQAQSSSTANQLVQLLGKYNTYKANFKQYTYFDSNQKPKISSGVLYMKRPGKFRWEVNKPSKQIIIANKNILWVYDVELEQVTKEKIDTTSSNNPAVLLSGDVKKLIKQYAVNKTKIQGKIWYQLKPRSSKSSFTLVRMRFSQNHLIAIWVKNNLNQVSLFQFSNIQLNKPLKASLFNFKPPKGVDVLQ